MRTRLFAALVLKDLTETLRDRRTLVMMILLPVLLYPMVIAIFGMIMQSRADSLEERPSSVVLLSELPGEALAELEAEGRIRLERAPAPARGEEEFLASARELVPSRADAAIAVAPDFADSIARGAAGKLWVYYDSVADGSSNAEKRVEEALDRYRQKVVAQREQSLGVPEGFARGLEVAEKDVAVAERKSGQMLGSLFPLLLLMMSLMGAFYPAIDLTAGEKERGTMETLLCAPIRPLELILGKFVAVCVVSLLSTTANLLSIALTTWFLVSRAQASSALHWQPEQLAVVLVLLAPTIIMMSALFLSVAVLARDFKDGQNLLTPLFTLIVVAGSAGVMPGLELGPWTAFVPVVNMVLLIRTVMVGAVEGNLVLAVLASSAAWATLALLLAARIFRQEQLLLGGGSSWRSVLTPRRIPDSLPTPAAALLLFSLILPAAFYGAVYFSGSSSAVVPTLAVQALGILLPTLVLAAFLRLSPKATFSLRMPSFGTLAAALLIGLTVWIVNYGLIVRLIPPPDSYSSLTGKALAALTSEAGLVGVVLLVAVTPAVVEELAFRGIVLRGLTRLGPPWAIAISALLFGLAHADMYRLMPAALFGGLSAWVVLRTGSILPGMLIHFCNNAAAVVLAASATNSGSWPRLLWDGSYPSWPATLAAMIAVAAGIFWTWKLTGRPSGGSRPPAAGDDNEPELEDQPAIT